MREMERFCTYWIGLLHLEHIMAFSGLLNNIASDLFHLIVEYFTRFVYKFLKSSSIQKTIKPTLRNSRQSFRYFT